MSRSIVTSFGGTLEVESVLGEFAEFRIVLPIATEDGDGEVPVPARPTEG